MAATSNIFCDNCAFQDVSRLAIKWCPECEQGLCPDCIQHHRGFKSSRNHVTIDIANYKKLPDFVSSVKLSCEEHDEKFQLFCPSHNVPCCGQCVFTRHTDCKGLFAMAEIVKNAKTSSALGDVVETLNAIRKNIEIIVKARALNLKDVQSQFQNVKHVVKETRQRIIHSLDRLENDLLDEIRNKESEFTNETEHILKKMGYKDLEVQEYQENIKAIKQYGTDIQTFFGTREIAAYVQAEEQRINVYFGDGTLNTSKIQFKLHEDLNKCLNARTLGSLHFENTKSAVKPVQAKVNAAQIGSPVSRNRPVDDIRVKIKTKFRISSGKEEILITGCDVTPDGKLVLADCYDNKRVVVHTIDGTYISEVCTSPKYAFDVSVIDEQSVAVSSAEYRYIQIVNLLTNKIIKTLGTSDICDGVAYLDGKVISSIYTQGIVSYGIQDNMSTMIRNDPLPYFSYVTCFQGRIYYTNRADNSVTCVNPNGDVLWKFIDKSLLQDPGSMATDQHGNVFVSLVDSNNILAISADGKHGRVILTDTDGINNAWGLCYDKLRDLLVVVNPSGHVFVFEIV